MLSGPNGNGKANPSKQHTLSPTEALLQLASLGLWLSQAIARCFYSAASTVLWKAEENSGQVFMSSA